MTDFLNSFTGFERILFYIAVPASLLTVIQLVLQFIGGGHDIDAGTTDMGGDFGHADMPGFSVFTISNLIYFLTMFGWSGIAASKAGASLGVTLTIGLVAGISTSALIAYIFFALSKLAQSGNVKLANAVGSMGSVYLTIPARRDGTGLVHVTIQGVTTEISAMTDGDELKTGKPIKVLELISTNVVLVERQSSPVTEEIKES